MKPSRPPRRRKPLARGTKPLKRTALKKSVKRMKNIRFDQEEGLRRLQVREAVFARDRRCVIAEISTTRCFGRMTVHHRRKSSAGGAYSVQNLVSACAGCNDQLEADADLASRARARGLVVRRGDPEWDQLGT